MAGPKAMKMDLLRLRLDSPPLSGVASSRLFNLKAPSCGPAGKRSAMSEQPFEFKGVTLISKANVYFAGKVVSHAFLLADGTRKTAGVILPGKFHFGTDKAERMQITAGECTVKVDGQVNTNRYAAGQQFEVPAKSGFDIEVATDASCDYICTFLG